MWSTVFVFKAGLINHIELYYRNKHSRVFIFLKGKKKIMWLKRPLNNISEIFKSLVSTGIFPALTMEVCGNSCGFWISTQYFGHLMQRTNSSEKTLMLGKIEGRREGEGRGWDGWMTSPTQWTWAWASSRCWWWTGKPDMLQSIGSQRVGNDWETELNWILPLSQTQVNNKRWYVLNNFPNYQKLIIILVLF